MKKILIVLLILTLNSINAQTDSLKTAKDNLYIKEVQDKHDLDKVLHAEPLYIDLIRDLGARKGEKEWNVGLGLTDNTNYDKYTALVEYEWAPVNRLGLEVELPFSIYYPTKESVSAPSSKLNSIKIVSLPILWTDLYPHFAL